MNSLPRDELEKALWAVSVVGTLRGKGGYSEEELAAKAKFKSVEHMRSQFARWGLPGWLSGEPGRQGRSPSPGSGQGSTKPPAERAVELFRERLRKLLADVGKLEDREDVYQDGRFVAQLSKRGSQLFLRYGPEGRALYSADAWRELCLQYDQDPTEDSFLVMDVHSRFPVGATPHPPEPLTALIGVYALAGGNMEALLEALHPGVATEEVVQRVRKQVEGKKRTDKVDGLRTVAGQLAQLVYGEPARGAPRSPLSAIELDAACYITMLRGEQRSDEEILAKLSNHRLADGRELSMADVHRLGNLRLRY
jgi:hypothetical protein